MIQVGSKKTMTGKYKCIVFNGSYSAKMRVPFQDAMGLFRDRIDFDEFDCRHIHDNHLSIEETVTKMKSGDMFIALSHPNQGLPYPFYNEWEMRTYNTCLSALSDTVGNVSGNKWRYKIWQQGKYGYLSRLADIVMPFMNRDRDNGIIAPGSDLENQVIRFQYP